MCMLLHAAKCVPINLFLHSNLSRSICECNDPVSGDWRQATQKYVFIAVFEMHNKIDICLYENLIDRKYHDNVYVKWEYWSTM